MLNHWENSCRGSFTSLFWFLLHKQRSLIFTKFWMFDNELYLLLLNWSIHWLILHFNVTFNWILWWSPHLLVAFHCTTPSALCGFSDCFRAYCHLSLMKLILSWFHEWWLSMLFNIWCHNLSFSRTCCNWLIDHWYHFIIITWFWDSCKWQSLRELLNTLSWLLDSILWCVDHVRNYFAYRLSDSDLRFYSPWSGFWSFKICL